MASGHPGALGPPACPDVGKELRKEPENVTIQPHWMGAKNVWEFRIRKNLVHPTIAKVNKYQGYPNRKTKSGSVFGQIMPNLI